MNLQHLCSTSHAEVYFDTANHWLFIDWLGDLTLPKVQLACLEIAHCYLAHSYPRVLNSNTQVTSATPDVADWLVDTFMPALDLAGVEQLAWVLSPALSSRTTALDTATRFAHLAISLFHNMEEAVSWLQQTAPRLASEVAPSVRSPALEVKLQELFFQMAQQLEQGLAQPSLSAL